MFVDSRERIGYTRPMKRTGLLAILILVCMFHLPEPVSSHPGKTDRYDGHKCLKGCEEWKLYYSEYHLHDKDRKPIRIAKKPKKQAVLKTAQTPTEVQVQAEAPVSVQTVTVYHYSTIVESSPFNPLLWMLLILLLLLLVLRLSRRQSEDK